jgi:hypothetical protein
MLETLGDSIVDSDVFVGVRSVSAAFVLGELDVIFRGETQ